MTPMSDVHAMLQEILQHHASAFPGFAAQPTPAPTSPDPVYQAALQACSALGFIAHDAECVAHAWQARSARMGHFAPTPWPDEPQDFGLQPAPRRSAFASCPQQLGLYAVLPDAVWVGRMARAGVPTVQLRFKSDDCAAVAREVAAAVQAVQGTQALLFINDHWRQAIEAGAYGVHLGQEDLDALQPSELQALQASDLRLGVSTHGTLPFQLAGNIRRGGLVEKAFGLTLRELLYGFGGGTASGRPVKAVQVGGPLGTYVPESQWDVPLDYEAYAAIGAVVGHGGLVVHDDTADMAGLARYAMEFCALESCGKCTPCRIGSTRGVEVIDRITLNRHQPVVRDQQVTLLRDLCETMVGGSLCAMGGMTPFPVLSALNHYPADFGL